MNLELYKEDLQEYFGSRSDEELDKLLAAAKSTLSIGQRVTGVVVTNAAFGVWIDIGVGLPCVLDIMNFGDLTRDHRQEAKQWCSKGATVEVIVGFFYHDWHQIGLYVPMEIGGFDIVAHHANND